MAWIPGSVGETSVLQLEDEDPKLTSLCRRRESDNSRLQGCESGEQGCWNMARRLCYDRKLTCVERVFVCSIRVVGRILQNDSMAYALRISEKNFLRSCS
jgi:hypothetical protein